MGGLCGRVRTSVRRSFFSDRRTMSCLRLSTICAEAQRQTCETKRHRSRRDLRKHANGRAAPLAHAVTQAQPRPAGDGRGPGDSRSRSAFAPLRTPPPLPPWLALPLLDLPLRPWGGPRRPCAGPQALRFARRALSPLRGGAKSPAGPSSPPPCRRQETTRDGRKERRAESRAASVRLWRSRRERSRASSERHEGAGARAQGRGT